MKKKNKQTNKRTKKEREKETNKERKKDVCNLWIKRKKERMKVNEWIDK